MEESIISFRCPEEDEEIIKMICRENGIDWSCYIVSALVHYVDIQVQLGQMERPDFMQPLPRRRPAPRRKTNSTTRRKRRTSSSTDTAGTRKRTSSRKTTSAKRRTKTRKSTSRRRPLNRRRRAADTPSEELS